MLSLIEQRTLISLLGKLSQPWTERVYEALNKLQPQVAIEAVTVRRAKSGAWEVLLTKRSKSDPNYPDQWHAPGTILRNREFISSAFKRLEVKEFGVPIADKTFLFWKEYPRSDRRAHIIALVYAVALKATPLRGKYASLKSLPNNLASYHGTMLPEAHQFIQRNPDMLNI